MAVSAPGDPHEQEADRVARRITGHTGPPFAGSSSRVAGDGNADGLGRALSGGAPLPRRLRRDFERRLGRDLSRVRLHRNAEAGASAARLSAHAYTVGSHIVFAAGQYAPESPAGRWLLAHELTHVLQQTRPAPVAAGGPEGARGPVDASPRHQPTIQRQFVTPLGAGGGFGGLMERDRRAVERGERETQAPPREEPCDVELCFLPLSTFLDMGIPPNLAYWAAVHVFVKWNGQSAGFTRLSGETIGDARVITPEPRVSDPHRRCVRGRLRTIPAPTAGQLITGNVPSYIASVARSLQYCSNPTCALSKARLHNVLIDDRRGLYDLLDENCETWARRVLSASCLDAPEVPGGGELNFVQRIWEETAPGTLYRLGRIILGRTRPLPRPTP